MYDHKDQFPRIQCDQPDNNGAQRSRCQRLKRASLLFLSLFASAATSNAMASEEEQFALTNQPSVLFDGGSGILTGEHHGIPYEIIQGFAIAQGDMVLGRILANGKLEIDAEPRGLGQTSAFERWNDGIVPFQFDDSVTPSQRARALQAIRHWNEKTRIRLVERTSGNADDFKDYLQFELSGGCASYVGRKGGEQTIWIADNCTVGSIIHEIGHAIGLFHEHTRPDRDNFVTVHLENVSSGKQLNFDKIESGADNYSEYDYGSIMHYGEYFFSTNGERSITVPDNIEIGQRTALSSKDISSVNTMYATDLKLDLSHQVNDENTQLDFLITNTGKLGASDLELIANWGENADWLSISSGSGWDCKKYEKELRCSRPTLFGNADTSFSVLARSGSATLDSLSVQLQSRTLDTDLSNNVFNDTITATPAQTGDPGSSQTGTDTDPNGTPVSSTNGGGGNSASDSNTGVDAGTGSDTSTGAGTSTGTETESSASSTAGTNGSASPTSIPDASLPPPQTAAAQSGDTVSDTGGKSSGGGAALYLLLLAALRFGRKSVRAI